MVLFYKANDQKAVREQKKTSVREEELLTREKVMMIFSENVFIVQA